MDKPVVLFLIDGLQIGGAERSLLLLCQHLDRFTPIVLVLSDSLVLKSSFEESGIQVLVKPFPRDYRFWKHAKALKPTVDSIKPSIIHSSLFHADMILRYLDTSAVKVSGLVSTMYSQGRLNHLSWLGRQKISILKLWDRWTAYRIDLFIANSATIKKLYQSEVGYAEDKVTVVYRGRTLTLRAAEGERKQHQLLIVGRLIPSKGLKEALQAFSLFSKKHQDFVLTIAGEGPKKAELIQLVDSLGIGSKVTFLGQVDRVNELLSVSSFFLFPSHYEGLPGVLIEAMFARIPIICSDIPENRECVDESMALFHRVGDAADLLAQMQKALTLGDWEARTQKAYAYAVEHFEIGKIARQYEELYSKLLNR